MSRNHTRKLRQARVRHKEDNCLLAHLLAGPRVFVAPLPPNKNSSIIEVLNYAAYMSNRYSPLAREKPIELEYKEYHREQLSTEDLDKAHEEMARSIKIWMAP